MYFSLNPLLQGLSYRLGMMVLLIGGLWAGVLWAL